MTGDGSIFARVGEYGESNFEIALTPMDALYAWVGLGGNGMDLQKGTPETMDILSAGQYGFGYTIENIGVLRVQYVGHGGTVTVQDTSFDAITSITIVGTDVVITYDPSLTVTSNSNEFSYADINAAFKLTAVPNLTVDGGVFIPTKKDDAGYQAKIAAGADYTMDQLTLHAMGFFGMPADGSDYAYEFRVAVDYNVDPEQKIGINADFMYQNEFQSKSGENAIGFLFGVTKGLAKGKVGVGVEVTTSTFAGGQPAKDEVDDMTWAIPILFEYSF
jgi:hypothetical protein